MSPQKSTEGRSGPGSVQMRGGDTERERREEGGGAQALLPTVEELSGWRSPPPQRPSAQTQTAPAAR